MDRFRQLLKAEVERTRPEAVAFRLGISVQTLANYISGKRTPTGDVVFRAFEAYPATLESVLPNGSTLLDLAASLQRATA